MEIYPTNAMAKLIINDVSYELDDGAPIAEICENAGIPFNCNTGVCGSCQVEVLEGAENLSPLTEEEKDLGLDAHQRLTCLCSIQQGTVKIKF